MKIETRTALAAIDGLSIDNVLEFFGDQATGRDRAIADLVDTNDDLEIDYPITSLAAENNGAWALAWVWVSFEDTELSL